MCRSCEHHAPAASLAYCAPSSMTCCQYITIIRCFFIFWIRPDLPALGTDWRVSTAGLTKMVSKLSREGSYRKGLEVFEALPAVGLVRTQPSNLIRPCVCICIHFRASLVVCRAWSPVHAWRGTWITAFFRMRRFQTLPSPTQLSQHSTKVSTRNLFDIINQPAATGRADCPPCFPSA